MLVPRGFLIDHGNAVFVLLALKKIEEQSIVLFFAHDGVLVCGLLCDSRMGIHCRTEDFPALAIAGVHVKGGGAGTEDDAVAYL